MVDFDVDLVVPFVDNADPVWRGVYEKYCEEHCPERLAEMHGSRFDDFGFFSYSLKLIDKFMPWIRKIHLIVSNPEQVPADINKDKTHIVLHRDIIPAEYLPTFNSTTIEMFIANIDGLAEHFIYANDDMYPVAPLPKTCFFGNDGKIKMSFTGRDIRQNGKQFRRVCLNCFQHVAEALGYAHDQYTYLKPDHSMTPMTVSGCKKCLRLLADKVYPNISAFRTEFQHNQYIYPLYERLVGNSEPSTISFKYTSIKHGFAELAMIFLSGAYQIVCLNDVSCKDRDSFDIEGVKHLFDTLLGDDYMSHP